MLSYFLFKLVDSFPVWPRNLLVSAGLEPVVSLTEKLCIVLDYRLFSSNYKLKKHITVTSFVSMAFGAINLIGFSFTIYGKESIIRCDK